MDARRTKLLNINSLGKGCSKAEIYRAHTQKCKALLHCTEALKHDNIEIFGL